MFLKSLQMQGFKSFPEKTNLNFEKGITGVVGPNGSGKSNISDAVRWVLGEQSSKSLRGSKMEDVIFDGTKVRKPFGFAQVTLTLDNSDRAIESVDSDEVAVSRKYFRSGESEYRINGELVRLKDVHQLFMDTGLGRDGYSMVSQGRVADLISDRNSQCREMLEEAAGISAYRYRRTDSIRQLDRAEENLLRLLDILKELEERVGPLKTQSEKAKKFLAFSDEKKELEIGLWLSNIEKLKSELKKHEEKLSAARSHFSLSEERLQKLGELIEESILVSQNATASIEQLRSDISAAEAKSAELSAQIAVFENSILHNESTVERIKGELESNRSDRSELEKEISSKEKIVSQITAILTKKQSELSEINARLMDAQSVESGMADEVKRLNDTISRLTAQITECRVRESMASSLISELNSRLSSLEAQRSEQSGLLSQRQAEAEKNASDIKDCLNRINEQSNVLAGVNMLLENHSQKLDELKKDADDENFRLSSLSSRIRMLEDLEKDMEGFSGAVKATLAAAAQRKLNGIEGTVAKLITVGEEHALAVETALGGAVQNVVCKTEGDAKRAIEYLKRGNHGRVTFQPISSVDGKVLSEPQLFDCEGFIGIASDLVECDEKYRKIIISLLGRIAVAEDLDYAIQIAKRFSYRFRIVTLDGQVVNAGGSITGGSKAQSAGTISRAIEIRKLSGERDKGLSALDEKKKKIDELSEKVGRETADAEKARSALVSLGEERIRLEGVRKLCDEQLSAASTALDSLSDEKTGLEERIAAAEHELSEQSGVIEKCNAEISSAEEGLLSLSRKQDDLASSSEELSERIGKLRLEIHDGEKDLTAQTTGLDLLKLRLIEGEDKDKALEDEIGKLFEENNRLTADIGKVKAEVAALSDGRDEMEKSIISLREKRTDAEKRTTELRNEEKAASDERQQLSGELARLEERKTSASEEYDATITRLYDEYELSLRQAQLEYSIPDDVPAVRRRVNELKNKIRALGSVNVAAIEEYKEVSERYEFMSAQLSDVEKSKKELQRLITELTQKMSEQFREKFEEINRYFGETFSELFGGGSAQLVLVDPTDILSSEIEIKLQPPGKAIKRLDSLSGGEKGLSAISLLFAILKVNPSPFCIFDEVEAALDESNVTRYAQYVRKMSKDTQFILITHRRGSMEEADRLYGITMQEQGVSKLLELKTAELAKEMGIK